MSPDPQPETRETPQVMVVRCLHCKMIVQDFGGGCFECGRTDGLRGTEATLFGRDALVMALGKAYEKHRELIRHYNEELPIGAQWSIEHRAKTWFDLENAEAALSAFDAAQEGKDG